MTHSSDIKATPLAQAKGAGSSKSGVSHWLAQRWTAYLNIPLSGLLLYWLLTTKASPQAIAALATSWWGIVLTLSLALFGYHGFLGLQVVCEDYIHHHKLRYFSLLLLRGVFLVAFLCGMSWWSIAS